jgi:hypothetical protein
MHRFSVLLPVFRDDGFYQARSLIVIERPFRNAKTGLRGFTNNCKRRGVYSHAAVRSALASQAVKDEFCVTEFSSQSLGASIKFPIEDKATAGAMLDGNDNRVFQPFCHPEPLFCQGNEIGVVFDENRNIKFRLEQLAKVDIGVLEYRTPERDTTVRIDESRQTATDSTDISDGLACLLQAGVDAANDKCNQLRRSQLPRFDRDVIGMS